MNGNEGRAGMKSKEQVLYTPTDRPLVIVVEDAGSRASARLRKVLDDADFLSGPIDLPHGPADAVPDAVLVIDASRYAAEKVNALGPTNALASRVVLITAKRDAAALVAALRAGVSDVVALSEPNFEESLHDAVGRIWHKIVRAAERRATKRAVEARRKSDAAAQRRLLAQTKNLCADLAETCRGMGTELAAIALASEVNALFRQELDMDGLLRTALEFTLRKVGPTNAAVFLRNSCEDFEVGAYANYDAPREVSEEMLGRMASALPGVLGCKPDPLRAETTETIGEALGEMPDGLRESALLAVGCGSGTEPAAMIALFRDRRQGFGETAVRTLRIVGRVFGEQTARIRKTQMRHLASTDWLGANDPDFG